MSERLRKAILDLVQKNMKVTITACIVKSVNETDDTCLCSPVGGGADFQDVKLRSIIEPPTPTSTRIIVYPKVDSVVLIGVIANNDNNTFVMEQSEIDSILIEMNPDFKLHLKSDKTVDINSPKIVFNNGTLGGLVKVNDLVTKLNAVESSLNTLKGLFNTWVPVAGDGGAALKGLSAGWAFSNITLSTAIALENPKIKQ